VCSLVSHPSDLEKKKLISNFSSGEGKRRAILLYLPVLERKKGRDTKMLYANRRKERGGDYPRRRGERASDLLSRCGEGKNRQSASFSALLQHEKKGGGTGANRGIAGKTEVEKSGLVRVRNQVMKEGELARAAGAGME